MKLFRFTFFLYIAILLPGLVRAETSHERSAPPLEFFVGGYEILGKDLQSGRTYSGTITMVKKNGKLEVQKRVNGKVSVGYAMIVRVIDDIPALRIDFTKNDRKLSATYQLDVDWNNYARLTGYLVTGNSPRETVAIEALFYSESISASEMPKISQQTPRKVVGK